MVVIGGSGSVGRHVCAAFQAEGYRVTAVARRPVGLPAGVRGVGLDVADADPVELRALLEESGAEVIVNAAGGWVATPEENRRVHVLLVERLLEAAARATTGPRFVQIGSIHEYGQVGGGVRIGEDEPPRPSTDYARTKLAGSEAVLEATRAGRLEGVVLRAVNVCGPGTCRVGFLGSLTRRLRAARPGEPLPVAIADARRDYVDVRDLARAVLRAARADAVGRVFNIGRGEAVSVRELVGLLLSAAGLPATAIREEGGGASARGGAWTLADIRSARELLGWEPAIGLARSLEDQWEASPDYRSRGKHG